MQCRLPVRLVALLTALVVIGACGGGEDRDDLEGRAVAPSPELDAAAHRALADRAGSEERWGDVIHHLREAVRLGEYDEESRYLLGSVWLRHGDVREMIDYYTATVEADPKPQTSWFFLGRARAKTGDLDAAIEAYRHAIAVDPAHELSHQAWGEALEARGEIEEAERHYRRAVEIDPTFDPGWQSLVRFLATHGSEEELAEARERAAAADELDPRHRPYYWAKVLAEEGREEAAREELRRVLAVDPDFEPARELAAELGIGPRSPSPSTTDD